MVASMLIHLHSHSYYSFLKGLPSPLELARAAAARQMPALALTDTEILSGAVEFYDACHSHGVRPILGMELPVTIAEETQAKIQTVPDGPFSPSSPPGSGNLVLLAQNMDGWSNLCRLSSTLQAGSTAMLTLEQLERYSSGLLCLTGGRRGLAAELLPDSDEKSVLPIFEQIQGIFGERLYIELQVWQGPYQARDVRWFTRLLRISHHFHLPLVATVDVHYISSEQARLQRVITAIQANLPVQEISERAVALPGSYFMDENEILSALQEFPLADPQRVVDTTHLAAERCQLELPLGVPHYPTIDLPGEMDADEVLRQRAERAAINLYGELTEPVRNRLEYELRTIETCGYASLFLIVEEILRFAREAGVPVSSRGSAASSLVAHCLGITSPDPIRLNLYFERFLNPMRVTPPDIDTDLCSRRRDQVIHFVYERFGKDRVAMVSTINRFRSRSALREVAKASGLSATQVSALLGKLPYRWYGPAERDSLSESAYLELSESYPVEKYQAIFRDAQALIGIPHHLSIHPGGVVIAPGPITDLAPVALAPKGILITQFDLVSIERLGLLKIDLLGIRGLTVLGDVAEAIAIDERSSPREDILQIDQRRVSSIRGQPQSYSQSPVIEILESIPEEDPLTSETILQARTIGCFQIESPGMRTTLREIQAQRVEDIMVALALYRPGPLTGGLKDAFVERYRAQAANRKSSDETFTDIYLHPALQPLLQETYGVILYQEQVLRIAHELASFSLSDADLLRRAMSHFDLDKQMQLLKEKFIQGANDRKAVPYAVAERIWELMAAFAGYGFPKAHAASYAVVGWRAAWCKTHYPAVFMAAVLANWGGYYSQRVYLTEARRMGLLVEPPHVNYAKPEFSVRYHHDQPVLYMGFGQVRELTHRTMDRILREQPFHSFSDFMVRVNPKLQEAQNLIRAGSLEGLGSQPDLLQKLKQGHWQAGQLPLFPDDFLKSEADSEHDWTLAEKVAAQEEVLGASLVAHPLELATEKIALLGALTTIEAAAHLGGQVRVAGMRQTWRRSRTRRGEYIYFMSLEDLEGMLDVVIPGEVYQKYRREFSASRDFSGPREFNSVGPYLIEGTVDLNPTTNEPTIRASRIAKIT
jgi:DNA polymerase III subunit alpha